MSTNSSTNKVAERYGSKKDFLTKFNPANQHLIVGDVDSCLFKPYYPTLGELNKDYGKGMAKAWLTPQIYNLCEYCGVKDKLNAEQYAQLTEVIATEFYYLKVTELMLFFHKFKCGHYGRFYGVIDPLVITTSLNQFISYRNDLIARHEQEENIRRRAQQEAEHPCITYEEYLKTKNQ